MTDSSKTRSIDLKDFMAQLHDILTQVGVAPRIVAKVGCDTNLFEEGIVDSVSLVAMAVRIEKAFNIAIPTADFEPKNFATPRAITEMLTRQPLS